MAGRLEFWFEFASPYSYIAAMRIEDMASAANVDVVWKPFLLGPIFQAQGWNDSPFNLYPAKGRYMWRDLERLCDKYQLPFLRPQTFPQNSLLAARLALVGLAADWGPAFVKETYCANFATGDLISAEPALRLILAGLEVDADAALAAAADIRTKDRLKDQTRLAQERGLFGAPSFIAGEEIFWGHDRLEDALLHAARDRTAP